MIKYHITSRFDFQSQQQYLSFESSSLRTEGFIHCSTKEQVMNVANRLFHGQPNLLLLCIDEDLIDCEIKYENLEGGELLFPHIYGAINRLAIVEVMDLICTSKGNFVFPK